MADLPAIGPSLLATFAGSSYFEQDGIPPALANHSSLRAVARHKKPHTPHSRINFEQEDHQSRR
jgi:hypothetical protein